MRVLILGAAGFLGTRLARRLAQDGRLNDHPISELVLCDLRQAPLAAPAACPITVSQGDLRDKPFVARVFARPFDAVFHLAAALTLDAELDFRHGLEVNVLGLVELLEHCRSWARAPLFFFASSISTYGGELPPSVDESVCQTPTTSYGTHKAIAEQLLRDYSRRGFIDARVLRLPIVLTHPGPPSGSISDQIASLIREPLRGREATCRILRDSKLAVASVEKVVDSFIRLAAISREALGHASVLNLPALSVSPAQISHAVAAAVPAAAARISWQPDPSVQAIIDGWPQNFTSQLAGRLGISPDESIAALVQLFLASEPA